jgi:hypothetical protein
MWSLVLIGLLFVAPTAPKSQHDKDVDRLIRITKLKAGFTAQRDYAEYVLAERTADMEWKRQRMVKAKAWKVKGNSPEAQQIQRCIKSYQFARRDRMLPLERPSYLNPQSWKEGQIGYVELLVCTEVIDPETVKAKISVSKIVGSRMYRPMNTMGGFGQPTIAVDTELEYVGTGTLTNLPPGRIEVGSKAGGLYKVVKAGKSGFELQCLTGR